MPPRPAADGPLLVFGPRSAAYDFGPGHPLTPLRFGPGIDLLRAIGAEPGLAPRAATDAALLVAHLPAYLELVRAFSANPALPRSMGIGLSDNPAFAGMHQAAAVVAGGSVAAMNAILRGDAQHAFHPGGGLHHAMADRAWGFCVYNDVALAVMRARAAGLRVLYVDLDVHHGDGVQALTGPDPGVLTVSVHESGRYLFPQTGFPDELGEGVSAGTSVNLPLEPHTGEGAWLAAVLGLVPSLAAVFGPDVVVSQHGSDAHAWDPLAHLRTTTTVMGEAARMVDAIAHRWAAGRWLATGGGGYDAYRVVPRAWALTWLAGAHREPPEITPVAWRERWAGDAAAFGTPGMPGAFTDEAGAGMRVGPSQSAASEHATAMLARVRSTVLPRLVREAEDRGWWAPALTWAGRPVPAGSRVRARATSDPGAAGGVDGPGGEDVAAAAVIRALAIADLVGLRLAPRTIPPFDACDGLAILGAALADGARVVAALAGASIVGVAVAGPARGGIEPLLAVGVAPDRRGRGLGGALLRALADGRAVGVAMAAEVGVAERDVVMPLPVEERIETARRLLVGADFTVRTAGPDIGRDDRWAILGVLPAVS